MLAALALVLLAFSATEGRILSKCELKEQLHAAQFMRIIAMGDKTSVDKLIARFVCNVEHTSGFNTSLITSVQINQDENRRPPKPSHGLFPESDPADSSGSSSEARFEEDSSGDSLEEEEREDVITGKLLGIFQLSDRVACASRLRGSLNLCYLECSALIDKDITDDIACLKTLVKSHGKFSSWD